MALRKAGISLTLEGQAAYKAGLAEINREQRLLSEQSKLAVAQLGTQASRQQTYSTNMDNYSKRIQSAADKTQKFKNRQKELPGIQNQISNSIKNTNDAYRDSARETDRLKNNYDQMRRALGSNHEETQKAKAAYQASKEETKGLSKEIKNLERAYSSNEKELSDLPFSLNKAELATQQLRNEAQKLHDEYRNAGGRMAETAENYQKFGNTMTNVGGSMQNIGGKLTTGVTLPLAGLTAAALTAGVAFEQQMSRVGAIAGATAEELKQLTDQAKELGATTAFSASEVAAGMENMASAGFSTVEILASMPGVLDLAAVSGGDVALASEAAATAVRAFSLEAGDAGHVADVFARAAADTNAEVADMAEAMKYAAPMANTLGLSIEDTAAAVGIMSDAGIKGSQAGTTLRGAFTRLAKPTKAAAESMSKLGIEMFDAQGNILPMSGIVTELQDGLAGMTSEQKASTLAIIFGQEAMSGMMTLVEAGPDKVDALSTSFENSAGAADEMARMMQDNAAGAIDEMMGALETAGIEITQALAPTIRDLAGDVSELVGRFSELDAETQQNIIKWAAFAMAAGPVLSILGNITSGVGTLSSGMGTLVQWFGKVTTPKTVGDMTTALSTIGGGATTTAAQVGGLTTMIGGLPVVLGVAGAALLGWTAWKVWGEDAYNASERTKQWGVDIGETATNALNDFQNLSNEASQATDSMAYNVEEGAQKAIESYGAMRDSLVSDIQETVRESQEVFSELPPKVQEMLKEAFNADTAEQQALVEEIGAIQADITSIYETAMAENRELTEAELTLVENYHNRLGELRRESLELSADEQEAVHEAMQKDLEQFSLNQLSERQKMLDSERDLLQTSYEEQAALIKDKANNTHEYNEMMKVLDQEHYNDMVEIGKEMMKVWEARGDIPEAEQRRQLEAMGLNYEKIKGILSMEEHAIENSTNNMIVTSEKATAEARKANDTWNGMEFFDKEGKLVTNAIEKIQEASQTEEGWNNLQYIMKHAELDTNSKEAIQDALMANGMWWEMDFPAQFADIETNAGTVANYFLDANGKWEGLSYETKTAILATNSTEQLRQVLIDTGVWENLNLSEQEMLMTTNAGQAARIALEAQGLWNLLEPQEKEMVMSSNATDKAIEAVNASFTWNGTNWVRKDIVVKSDAPQKAEAGLKAEQRWNGTKWQPKKANVSTNAPETESKLRYANKYHNATTWNPKKALVNTNSPDTQTKLRHANAYFLGTKWKSKSANINTNAPSTQEKLRYANDFFNSIRNKTRTFTLEYKTIGSAKAAGTGIFKEKGTNYHLGGPMIVNDQKGPTYKELITYPNGKSFVPEGRNVFIPNAPKGTKVLKASLTKPLIPKYEKGIGYDERSIRSANAQPAVSINIEIKDPVVREEQDINKISNAVVEKITLNTQLKNLFNKGRGGAYAGA